MKYVAITFILVVVAAFWLLLNSIDTHLRRATELQAQELVIKQIEVVASFCDSRSGRVEYDKTRLDCTEVKPTPEQRPRLDPGAAIIEL